MSRLQITDNHDWKAIKDCIQSSQQDFDLEITKLDLEDMADLRKLLPEFTVKVKLKPFSHTFPFFAVLKSFFAFSRSKA